MHARRTQTVTAWLAGVSLAALLLGAVGIATVTNTEWGRKQVRARLLSALRSAAHGQVTVGRVSGNLLRGITLHDLRIADNSGAPFVLVRAVHAGYGLRALVAKRIHLDNVVLDSATIVLDRSASSGWNYERIFPRATAQSADSAAGFGDWVVLTDVTVRHGRLLVRTPWQPDASLAAGARDSLTVAAAEGSTRTAVVRNADGSLQQVQDFRAIHARLPLVRLAHPRHTTRLVLADSVRMQAFAFAPPAADIRQLSGEFELNGDSLWFREVAVTLPASRAQLSGRYTFARGDLALQLTGTPIALRDVRFLYPPLPNSGSASLELQLLWENGVQRYVVRALNLQTGPTVIRGEVGFTRGDTLMLHRTSLEFSSFPTSLLEQLLPTLKVPRDGVLAGRVIVSGTPMAMRLDTDVVFDDLRAGRSRILAAGEVGAAHGAFRAEQLRITLSPLQVSTARAFLPTLPVAGVLSGNATLDGKSVGILRATALDLTHVQERNRSRVTGRAALRMGRSPALRWIDAQLRAQPVALRTIGAFAPAAGLRGSVSGPIWVQGLWSALMLDAQLRSSDGGTIDARGTLDLASRDPGYALDVRTSVFNANALSDKAPRSSLSALIQMRIRGVDPATMRGSVAAVLRASTLDTVAVDSLQLRARMGNGLLTLDSTWVTGPGARLDATGTFGLTAARQGTLFWRARIDSLVKMARYFPPTDSGTVPPRPLRSAERVAAGRRDSLRQERQLGVLRAAGEAPPPTPVPRDTTPALPRDSLGGSLRAAGTVSGGLKGFDLHGTLEGLGIVARGSRVRRVRARFGWRGARTDSARYEGTLSADSLIAAGFAFDRVSADVTHQAPGGRAAVTVHQSDAREYNARASYALFTDRRELTIDELRLRFDTTEWRTGSPGAIRWGRPGFFVDSIDLRSGGEGRVFAHGLVPTEGAADLRLIVDNFQLGDLLGLAQSDLEGAGRITLDGRVTGSGRSPQVAARLRLQDARYRETPVPGVEATLSYADRRLDARAVLADSSMRRPRTVAIADASVPIDLAFTGVTGPRILDAPARATLVADSLPLDLLARVTDALEHVRGAATGRATLRGTLKKPIVAGAMSIASGRADLTALGITMDRVNGRLRFTGDSVFIDSLAGWNRGRMAVRGALDIRDIARPGVNLTLDVDGAEVIDNDRGRLRADATITARGPFEQVRVEGRAHVREGVIYLPKPGDREVISAGDPNVFAVIDTTDVRTRELIPAQSPILANLQMDIALTVDRDTWVRSSDANVEIYSDGALRILVDRRRSTLTLDGVINTDRGEYEFLSKRFLIKRGAVQFVGTREINPLLQITGEYEVQQPSRPALNIRILIGGTLRSPRLTLESDAQPPMSQSDLLSYLAFGSESGSLLQFGGSSLSGGTGSGGLVGTSAALATRQLTGVALGVAVDELEGQAARSLGADVVKITPANVPPELASGNFGALSTFLRGTQFEFGKYINTRTFVGLQLQATTTPGFRVERQLSRTPGVSMEATFQPRFFLPAPSLSQQEITKANALGLFLTRRWRF